MRDTSSLHQLDRRVAERILRYGGSRFPAELQEDVEWLDSHPMMSPDFATAWLIYIALHDERPLIDWYLDEHALSLPGGTLEWLEAQQKSWLSIWEVLEVERGRVVLRDRLTDAERVVHDVKASEALERHWFVLARIVDSDSTSLFCGMYPAPLGPYDGLNVIEKMRKLLRRRTAVQPQRLRDWKVAARMVNEWSAVIARHAAPPQLQNLDGDPLLLTEDRWTFDAAQRQELLRCIASIEGADAVDENRFSIVGKDDTLLGRIAIGAGVLTVSTNSIARADARRSEIELACAGMLRSHVRSHSDPASSAHEPSPAEPPVHDPEADAMIAQLKEQHYAKWLNDPLPSLNGKTPVEAVRTKRGREQVDAILKHIELIESHSEPAARYDAGKLRDALGLHTE